MYKEQPRVATTQQQDGAMHIPGDRSASKYYVMVYVCSRYGILLVGRW